MNEAKERIKVLIDGKVITSDIGRYVCSVIELLDVYGIKTDKEITNMMLTHLAMATQRILEGRETEMLDNSIWKEIEEDTCYGKAKELLEKIEELSFLTYPEGERRYLMMHICNMLH